MSQLPALKRKLIQAECALRNHKLTEKYVVDTGKFQDSLHNLQRRVAGLKEEIERLET